MISWQELGDLQLSERKPRHQCSGRWWSIGVAMLLVITVQKRGVTEIMAPEHGFWNGHTPVSGGSGDDLVSVRFLEQVEVLEVAADPA